MNDSLIELLPLATSSIAEPEVLDLPAGHLDRWGPLGANLATLLGHRNGFYALDSALLVRPLRHSIAPLGVVEWNEPNLWKGDFADDLSQVLFFAEDLFGGQFGIRGDRICHFDPETGDLQDKYGSLDEWADAILADNAIAGGSLARSWNTRKGNLRPGTRLIPKMPFVCGGTYEIDNLYPLADVQSMTIRASLANQIRSLPDGAEIVLDLGNEMSPRAESDNG